MPMYGDHGLKLVVQAKRAQNLAHLPPYETELVRETAREVRDLDRDVANILEPFQGSFDPNANQGVAGTLLTNHLSMRRNKRCLLAYHRTRTNKLEELVWRGADVVDLSGQQVRDGIAGGNAPGAGGRSTDSGTSSLSPQEEDYVRQYGDLLAAYKGQWTDIDLTGSLEPPRDLFIDVRVLKDAGEIQTEYGAITLTKNSQFYVRQGDVERLIAQGYLQKLS
ncbi:DNA replication protein psf1 [Gnomoniopsis sp. IMI 355080]|nr:DNA replication protein psf1 [Gnomoniopsis sp. IMI 355080]